MNKNLRLIYEHAIQSRADNYKKTMSTDFDPYYVAIFAELMLKDVEQSIDDFK